MKFTNVQDALDFIQSGNSPNDMKIELMDLIVRHVQEGSEIQFAVHKDEIQSVLFQSEHDVLVTVELESVIIHAHTLTNVTSITKQTKETIMNAQNTTQDTAQQLSEMEAAIAQTMQKVMASSMESVLDEALTKQQGQIDAAVKKTVDEAVKKALEESAKTAPKAEEAPKSEETKKPTAEKTKKATDGFVKSLGKTAVYAGAAVGVAVGGYFAWKKWGASASAAQ